jgi:hypothetical protein
MTLPNSIDTCLIKKNCRATACGNMILHMLIITLLRRSGWPLLLLAACGTNLVYAQESSPQICFLHLKLVSNQVSLVSASISPGTLKRFSEHRPALDLEVATSAGQVLWTNNVADPSIRRLEYEDPDHPREIISKEVQLTNTEFTVRVPLFRDAHHVNFYLSQPPAGTNAAEASPAVANVSAPQRKVLGTVMLPQQAK